MNSFLVSCIRAITKHGLGVVFSIKTGEVYDPSTLKKENVYMTYPAKVYPKQIQATQYNYPSLIGKDAIEFYLANNVAFTPVVGTEITYRGLKYSVQKVRETVAGGQIVLYRLLATKG